MLFPSFAPLSNQAANHSRNDGKGRYRERSNSSSTIFFGALFVIIPLAIISWILFLPLGHDVETCPLTGNKTYPIVGRA